MNEGRLRDGPAPSTPAETTLGQVADVPRVLTATLVGVVWLVIALLPLRALPRSVDDAPGLDSHIYIAMAESPSVFTMPPFGYRIGVPLIVHALPFSPEVAFFVVTCVSLLACFVLLYLLLFSLGFGHGLSLLGMSLVAAAPDVSRYLGNYFLVDPAALACVAALLLGIERKWPAGRLALLLLVGSLFKENVVMVAPVLYWTLAEDKWIDRRALQKTLAVVAPAFFAALFLRFCWGSSGAEFPYLTPWSVPRRAWIGSMGSYRDIWQNLFGFLGLVAVVNAFSDEWRGFVRRYAAYFVLVVAQLLVPMNEDRLLFFAFPVIVPLALVEFRSWKTQIPSWFPLLATLLVFIYLFAPGELIVPLGLVLFGRLLMERAQ